MKAEDIVRIGEDLKKDIEGMSLPHAMRYVGDILDNYPEDNIDGTLIAAFALNVGLMSEAMMFEFISSQAKDSGHELVLTIKSYYLEDAIDYAPTYVEVVYDNDLPYEEKRKMWEFGRSVRRVVNLFDTEKIYGYIYDYTRESYPETYKIWKFNPDGTIEEDYKG